MHRFIFAIAIFVFSYSTYANTFLHNPPRLMIASDSYPWRVMGKLINCPNCKTGCSAFLVSDKHIVTNRHCVYNEDKPTELQSLDFYFIRNPMGDDYHAEAFTARVVSDGFSASQTQDTAYDWAILELNYPIGAEVGYVGLQSPKDLTLPGYRGTRPELPTLSPFSDPYADLCKETRNPFPDFLKLISSSPKGSKWFIPPISIAQAPLLCLSGYPGDAGEMNQVLSQQCTFVGQSGLSYFHDCASTRGSSGSAIFFLDENNLSKVVSVNRGGFRPGDVSVINAPINMNNTNISTEIETLMVEVENLRNNAITLLPTL